MQTQKKVLIAHIPYEHRGGEDAHVDALIQAYPKIGFEPVLITHDSKSFRGALKSINPVQFQFKDFDQIWDEVGASFVHIHNIYPVLGPRFLRWLIQKKIPTVMTVHNHRFYCTNGLALRSGKICKDCFHSRSPWRSLVYNCNDNYKKSSYYMAALTETHKLWEHAVQKFIAPSPYIKNEIIEWGIPRDRVTTILNPVLAIENIEPSKEKVDVFFAGRLSQEKGILKLLKVVERMEHLQFGIFGDGPMHSIVESASKKLKNLKWSPKKSRGEVYSQIQSARIGILPSICNEILPTFVLECAALGTRCVVPDLESTRWFAEEPWDAAVVNTKDVNDVIE